MQNAVVYVFAIVIVNGYLVPSIVVVITECAAGGIG